MSALYQNRDVSCTKLTDTGLSPRSSAKQNLNENLNGPGEEPFLTALVPRVKAPRLGQGGVSRERTAWSIRSRRQRPRPTCGPRVLPEHTADEVCPYLARGPQPRGAWAGPGGCAGRGCSRCSRCGGWRSRWRMGRWSPGSGRPLRLASSRAGAAARAGASPAGWGRGGCCGQGPSRGSRGAGSRCRQPRMLSAGCWVAGARRGNCLAGSPGPLQGAGHCPWGPCQSPGRPGCSGDPEPPVAPPGTARACGEQSGARQEADVAGRGRQCWGS